MSMNVAHDIPEFLPELEVDGPGKQRRSTVLLRILLLIPQFVALFFLFLAAAVVTVIGWFAALVLGRLPAWVVDYLNSYLGYSIRVSAYLYLLVDRYPPFTLKVPSYPARIILRPDKLNRLAVLFRLILVIPAYIINTVIGTGWLLCSFFCWLAVLITGRTPIPVFGATSAVLRYSLRFQAYLMMLSSAYPKRLFGDPVDQQLQPLATEPSNDEDAATASNAYRGTRPLVLSSGGRALLVAFIIFGILGMLPVDDSSNGVSSDQSSAEQIINLFIGGSW